MDNYATLCLAKVGPASESGSSEHVVEGAAVPEETPEDAPGSASPGSASSDAADPGDGKHVDVPSERVLQWW